MYAKFQVKTIVSFLGVGAQTDTQTDVLRY